MQIRKKVFLLNNTLQQAAEGKNRCASFTITYITAVNKKSVYVHNVNNS